MLRDGDSEIDISRVLATGSGSTSMVLADIVERHAQQAAFLWQQRDSATRSPAYDLEALHRLDDRLDAHIDGLRIADDVGWKIAREALAVPDGGEVFVATVLAVEREEVRALAQILARHGASHELGRAIASALGWVSLGRVKRFLDELLAADAPVEIRHYGIAGSAVHRHDPGEPLAEAAWATDPRLQARALRAIGELGRADLLPALRGALDSNDDRCRFWAAWSATILGEPAATEVLWRLASEGGAFAQQACGMAVRCTAPAAGRARLLDLAMAAGKLRVALAGAAASGDPGLLPWLLDCMAMVEHARFAAWAFALITGVDLMTQKLSGPPPRGFRAGPTDDPDDSNVKMDADAGLPWPEVALLQRWWKEHSAAFPSGSRLLLGTPIEQRWLWHVLRGGSQPGRAAAAIEIALARRGRPLFEVRAPAFRQRQLLQVTRTGP